MRFDEYIIARLIKAGFEPTQQRVPAGYRDGGRWSSSGISIEGPSQRVQESAYKPQQLTQSEVDRLTADDPPLRKVYPVRDALLAIGGGLYLRRVIQEAAGYIAAENGLAALAARKKLARLPSVARAARFGVQSNILNIFFD